MALSRSIRAAVTHVADRLGARLRDFHRTLGRRMKQALDESASPSCCVGDKVERVKSLVIPEGGEPASRATNPKKTPGGPSAS